MCEYPNLPLVEERARLILMHTCDVPDPSKLAFDCYVFPQIWPNTAGGFYAPGMIAGQSMIKSYTTVVHESALDQYLIFFGNDYAYRVYDPTPEFIEDWHNNNIANSGVAKVRY